MWTEEQRARHAPRGRRYPSDLTLTDIPQMTSNFVEIVPLFHRQGNCIPLQPSDGQILKIGPRLEALSD